MKLNFFNSFRYFIRNQTPLGLCFKYSRYYNNKSKEEYIYEKFVNAGLKALNHDFDFKHLLEIVHRNYDSKHRNRKFVNDGCGKSGFTVLNLSGSDDEDDDDLDKPSPIMALQKV